MIVPDEWIVEAETGQITLAQLGERVLEAARARTPDTCTCGTRLYHGQAQRIRDTKCPIHGKRGHLRIV